VTSPGVCQTSTLRYAFLPPSVLSCPGSSIFLPSPSPRPATLATVPSCKRHMLQRQIHVVRVRNTSCDISAFHWRYVARQHPYPAAFRSPQLGSLNRLDNHRATQLRNGTAQNTVTEDRFDHCNRFRIKLSSTIATSLYCITLRCLQTTRRN
jgi:hypothetical protein